MFYRWKTPLLLEYVFQGRQQFLVLVYVCIKILTDLYFRICVPATTLFLLAARKTIVL